MGVRKQSVTSRAAPKATAPLSRSESSAKDISCHGFKTEAQRSCLAEGQSLKQALVQSPNRTQNDLLHAPDLRKPLYNTRPIKQRQFTPQHRQAIENASMLNPPSSSGEVAAENQAAFRMVNSLAELARIGTNTRVYLDATSSLILSDTSNNGINTYSTVYLSPGASITFENGSEFSFALAQKIINPATGKSFFEDYYLGANGTPATGADSNNPLYIAQGPQSSFILTGSDLTPFGTSDSENPIGNFTITAIPEPNTSGLFLLSVSLFFLCRNKQRRTF